MFCLVHTRPGHLLLDHNILGPEATARLALAASLRTSTLRTLDVRFLSEDFLPAIMPDEWRRSGSRLGVRYIGAAAADGGSSAMQGVSGAAGTAPLVTW